MSNAAPIFLSVPAEPAFARTVRMTAANLAVLSGMSVDDVEDMRMAAEESFVWACATKPSVVEITFSLADGLGMELGLGSAKLDDDDQTGVYARLILQSVCDEFSCDDASKTLKFFKKAVAADA